MLQGYNVDIRHIPGKKNPADSLSRQLITDALVRKSSVTDANAQHVQRLRVQKTQKMSKFKMHCTNYLIQALKTEIIRLERYRALKAKQFCQSKPSSVNSFNG